MKSIRIEDDIHERLTSLVGELTAESGKMKTYADAIQNLLGTSVVLPKDLVVRIQELISQGKLIGYKNHIDFVRDAIRDRLKQIKEEEFYVNIPIPREEYDVLDRILNKTSTPYSDPSDYLRDHVHEIAEKYQEETAEEEG